MKLKLFLFFLACFSLNTNAQLLWKITGKGLKAPSYLMGTHHLAPLSIMDSIKGMQTALNSTTQVIGELNMSDIHKPGNIQLLQKKMMIECDTTLQTLLSPSDYDTVNKFTKEYFTVKQIKKDMRKPAKKAMELVPTWNGAMAASRAERCANARRRPVTVPVARDTACSLRRRTG